MAAWTPPGDRVPPYRADQMDALITMQCGPIRHEIEDRSTFARHLIVHRCDFTTDEPGTDRTSIP